MLLVAAGLVGCADDDAETDTEATVTPESSATTAVPVTTVAAAAAPAAAVEAAFEFAQCMRDNGIEEFADPQLRADGDFFLQSSRRRRR